VMQKSYRTNSAWACPILTIFCGKWDFSNREVPCRLNISRLFCAKKAHASSLYLSNSGHHASLGPEPRCCTPPENRLHCPECFDLHRRSQRLARYHSERQDQLRACVRKSSHRSPSRCHS